MLKSILFQIPKHALDLLFPLSCVVCHREGHFICLECEPALPRLVPPYCPICATPDTLGACRWCSAVPLSVDGIRAPFILDGPIREAVHSLKYRGVRAFGRELGRFLARYLEEHPAPGDLIAPVPLHRRRLRDRGYNQSELLARSLAKESGLDLDVSLLSKVRHSAPQVGASREQRRSNVEGSFQCRADLAGKAVILVDDVATTGSTLSACASALKDAGASSVWGLALARESWRH